MVTIIIFAAIGAVIAFLACYEDMGDVVQSVLSAILGIIAGVFVGFLVGICFPVKTEMVKTQTYQLEALQDGSSVKGDFMLGCGSVDGSMKYVFYYKDGDTYTLKTVDCDEAKVKYSNEKPMVEKFEEVRIKGATINLFSTQPCFNTNYIIYVPEGTIKQNITLDAQ